MKKFFLSLLPFLALAGLAFLFTRMPQPLEAFRLKYFDTLMNAFPRPYPQTPVRIVDLDDVTLEKFGQWPWPRTLVARLIDRLREEKVSVIALDILFAEPDRTSPSNLLPLWLTPSSPENLTTVLKELPDHDQVLVEAFGKVPVVTAFGLSSRPEGSTPVSKAGFSFAGEDPRNFLPDFPGAVTTLPEFEKAAKGNGMITYIAEFDGTIRSVSLVAQLRNALYPSLLMEALRLHWGVRSYALQTTRGTGEPQFGAKPGILRLKIGNTIIPTDEKGRIRLYDSGYRPERNVPAWQVLENKIPEGSLENAIVFIGTSAAGLKDIRATPLNPAAAGVEVHAQLTEQILTGTYLLRPDWAEGAEFCFFIFTGLLLIFFLPRLGAVPAAALTVLFIAAFYGFSIDVFRRLRWLVDPGLPSAAAFVIYIISSLIHFLKTESEKREIRGAFNRYLSPSLVEQIVKKPSLLKLGGEMKSMTVLFADLRGFTSLAERMQPEELTRFLNHFLTPMTQIILDHGGTIDKYMGDAIMAFWNAPVEEPLHSLKAGRAALAMQKALLELNKNQTPAQMGIGINTGQCCVGNMGSEQRFDYSVIGDSVNLASRLESLSKLYGVEILTGPETFQAAKDALFFLEADQVRVKGKQDAVHVYTLLGESGSLADPVRQKWQTTHQQMLTAYRSQKWDEALTQAKACQQYTFPEKNVLSLYQYYEKKIEALRKGPSDSTWDSVTTLDSK